MPISRIRNICASLNRSFWIAILDMPKVCHTQRMSMEYPKVLNATDMSRAVNVVEQLSIHYCRNANSLFLNSILMFAWFFLLEKSSWYLTTWFILLCKPFVITSFKIVYLHKYNYCCLVMGLCYQLISKHCCCKAIRHDLLLLQWPNFNFDGIIVALGLLKCILWGNPAQHTNFALLSYMEKIHFAWLI